ncbi:Ig-like domain-containing protein [Myxococcus qinghaiensis]|uniref:Ig-like domain-containing protein n=1 Tax=Myxococcus qinghaiensis TaxID=2906758 RepID=UPI0020A7BEC4|nr:Ig-like domain-containing protein [Myxococcus qinghaiensis]MCP3161380.1 Ig-like domain-containing protein [Myxococcus qinghaiensis]
MKSSGWMHLLTCVVALVALPAFAEADVFGLGAGRDEALTVQAHESRVINSYAAVTAALNKGDHELRVDAAEGFAAGDLVMVLQTVGVGPVRASSVATFTFGPREQSPEGVWELARVARVRGGLLTLTRPLLNDFVPFSTQVIRVPEYTSVTIHPTGELKARSWSGTSGGVVAFLASGALHNGGTITASGALLRQQPLGDGGVVFFRARRLTGAGRIEANGQAMPWDLGTEGGGEGGSISARLVESAECEALMAQGGPGAPSESFGIGEGFGPGAGGKVLLQAGTLTGCPVHVTGGESASGDASTSVGEPGDVTLVEHSLVIPRTPVITTPGDGQGMLAPTPVITGMGDPGATVFLRMGNVERPATPEREFPAMLVGASGEFSVRVPKDLDDGIYSLTAHAEFEGLSSLSSDPVYFTLEALAPPLTPVILTPTEGAKVGIAGTAFSGTAEPLSRVDILMDGDAYDSIEATALGDWSLPIDATLDEGEHTLSVTATDADDSTSPAAERTFTVDKTVPLAPVILAPVDDAKVGISGTAFSGTAEVGSTVTVLLDGAAYNSTVTIAAGTWSLPTTTTLAAGAHTVSVTARDPAGNTSAAVTHDFTVDKTAPLAPVILAPVDDAKVGIAGIAFSGTAEIGSTVTVLLDGAAYNSTVATATGTWALPTDTTLTAGAHTVTATARDASGNTGPAVTHDFTVDKTAPLAPVILSPVDDAKVGIAGIAFSGTAEIGSTVTVLVDGAAYNSTVATATGTWALPTDTTLTAGAHTVTATARDGAGNTGPAVTHDFTVDKTAPLAPVILVPVDDAKVGVAGTAFSGTAEIGSTVTVLLDGAAYNSTVATATGTWALPTDTTLTAGAHTVTATARDGAGNTGPAVTHDFTVDKTAPLAPVILTPVEGAVVGTAGTDFSGTAEPLSTVTVVVDGTASTPVTANATGDWALPVRTGLTHGSHTVTATAKDATGNTSPVAQRTFNVDITAPIAPVILTPTEGAVLGTSGTDYTGTAEALSTVNVRLDGALIDTVQAGSDGRWTVLASSSLAEGAHKVTATATDAAHNEGPAAERNFTVDATPPSTPVILTPANNAKVGIAGTAFSGTAEVGSTVTVLLDGDPYNTAVTIAAGTWSLPVDTTLTAGAHTVSVTARDATGNTSPAVTNNFTVDKTAPLAPVILTPIEGAVVGTTGTDFSGTAEPSSTVTVVVDGTASAPITASAAGEWSLPVRTGFTHGSHTVTATARDGSGNTSPAAQRTFDVDIVAPVAPVIQTPNPDTVVGPAGTAFSGTAERLSTVNVSVDGLSVGTTTANATGNWSLSVRTGFANGIRTVTATATDGANNKSLEGVISFTVDVTPPDAPVIQTPNPGTVVGATGTAFSGTAEPLSNVEVRVDGVRLGTTQASAGGSWLIAPHTFTHGTHTVTATATDALTNVSVAAESSFTVDLQAPDAPVIQTPNSATVVGSAGTAFSGTAENLSKVTVRVDGTQIGIATTSATGTWSLPVRSGFTDGSHTVTATAADAQNNTSAVTTITFTVDITAPTPPVIQTPTENQEVGTTGTAFSGTAEALSTVSVSVDGAVIDTATTSAAGAWALPIRAGFTHGAHTVTATATDALGNTSAVATRAFTVDIQAPDAPVIQTPNTVTVVGSAGTAFSGTAESLSKVTVRVDGNQVGIATASAAGAWSLPVQSGFADGPHTVTATAADAQNNTSAVATTTFTVDITPPAKPVIQTPSPTIVVGPAGTAFLGTAERLSIVRVSVDGTVIASPTATSEGTWSIAVRAGYSAGVHTVTATATDALDNTSLPAETTFTVDLTPPAAPTILTPTVDTVVGQEGTAFSGTAEPRSTVNVTVDGDPPVAAPVSASGNWSLPTQRGFTDGFHLVSATATDPANNTSSPTEVRFTVDVTAPSAPTIGSPASGTLVGQAGTGFSGTAERLSTVKLLINESAFATAVTGSNGQWLVPVLTTLANGIHTVTATATDAANNVSAASTGIDITVDTLAPVIPTLTSPAVEAVVASQRPDFIGTTEAGARVSIFIDSALSGTVTATSSGNWTFAPGTALSERRHDVQVRATDLAGNVGDLSSARAFRVDVTPPTTVVTKPAQNATLTDSTPEISGTAEADSTVFITMDGTRLPGVIVDGAGNWTYEPPAAISHGRHDIQVQATDLAGNQGPRIVRSFTLDLVLPGEPALVAPANASLVNTRTPLIRGTAQQNCILTVRLDGLPQDQKPVVDSAGEWKFTPTTGLTDGLHLVSAYCTDGFGRASTESGSHAFTVDTTAPGAPLVVTPTAEAIVGPGFNTLTGTAEPGTTLTASLNGLTVGTTQANERGEWAIQIGLAIISGPQNLLVWATDVAGNTGAPSTPRAFVVDILPPTTTLSGGPKGTSTLSEVTFTLTPSEPVASFKCTLDGVELEVCENPLTVRSLSEGTHTLDVLATDFAGNVQLVPAHHQWNVIRPSLVEGGGVGCSSTAGAFPLGLVWLAWVGLVGLRRRR